jgi:phage FluMu protein Com
MSEIRCPSCNRLLARIVASDDVTRKVEVRRRGKPIAIVEKGQLQCQCGEVVEVSAKANVASGLHKAKRSQGR